VLDEAYLDCLDDDATTPADSATTQPDADSATTQPDADSATTQPDADSATTQSDADVDGHMPPNVLRLRSLTKAHGLAGLRLGYALARRHILAPLRLLQPPWSVNALAQAAGLAVLADTEHLQQTRTRWHAAKRELVGALVEIGLAPVPSAVPFFLVRVPNAARVRERLLHRGLLVRDAASFGLVDHLRICARGPSDNRRLVQALAELRREAEGWGG
jgi:histidinol-phosphate/aromatic aminotransferase/cobyric acid decarboxylase-like protein